MLLKIISHNKDQKPVQLSNPKTNKKMLKVLMAIGCFSAGLLSYPFLVKVIPGANCPNQTTVNPVLASPSTSTTKANSNSGSDIEDLNVCFTPNQSCLPQVLKYIANAQSSISLLGYSFTSKPITDALIKAKQRGVKVRIVLDHSQKNQKPSQDAIKSLLAADIAVQLDHSVKIAHNKILIIDDHQIVTGSYNWSHAAEFNNAENLVFIKSRAVAKKYKEYFEARWEISKPYTTVMHSTLDKTRKRKRVYPKHASVASP